MLQNLLLSSAQSGQGGSQRSGQQSGQQSDQQQGGSGTGLMSLLSKASRSGHSAVVSGAMALVSAYRSRRKNRQRAMRQAVVGVALLGFGLWQIRRQGQSKSMGGGSSGQRSSGGQQASGQQAMQ